ncbi:DNA helicase II [Peptoniphilus indolicus ATCC 29427]|uniref:DNA helicase II n=1 Tax=Peptoniphilus indolicus ATCC 29427 TaxID=997350 RepID=G4D3Z7_9FIRM|nr:DNA helicase II [Peptoniphilus indolicus ATCC 29427]
MNLTSREIDCKFFNHFVVRDVLNIIKFSYNMDDIDLFSEIYYKIKGYISKNIFYF